jgi:hypothetical protein
MKKGLLLLLTSLFAVSSLFAQDVDILRRKYSQVSYGKNTFIHNNWKMKSDFAVNFTSGRTFYLHEDEVAGLIRQHNNANVVVLPARFISNDEAMAIVEKFLSTDFEGGRHIARVEKIACK